MIGVLMKHDAWDIIVEISPTCNPLKFNPCRAKHHACWFLKPQGQVLAGHATKKSSSQFVFDFSRPFVLPRNSLALIFHGYTHKSEIYTSLYSFYLMERARTLLRSLCQSRGSTLWKKDKTPSHMKLVPSTDYPAHQEYDNWLKRQSQLTSIAEKLDFFFYWNGRKWIYFNFSRFSIMAAMTMWLLLKELCLHHTHSLPLVSPFVLKYETSHFCNCMINYKSPPLEVTFSRRESLWSISFLSLEVVCSNNISSI